MTRIMAISALAAIVALSAGRPAAFAQSKTIPGRTETAKVTVEAIDHANREVTVKKSDDTYDVLYVPRTFASFDSLKVGDTITTRYYENVVLRVKHPGEKDVNESTTGVTRGKETATGTAGTLSHQRTITATITALDPEVPSITFSGPHGWKYSTRVEDKDALTNVKVGDRVDITWTEAVVLALEPGK